MSKLIMCIVKLAISCVYCKCVRMQCRISMNGFFSILTVQKIRSFLLVLFVHLPSHMELVLQSLTMLNSALPTISFLSMPLIMQLLHAADGLVKSRDPEDIVQSIYSTQQVRCGPGPCAQGP